MLLPRSALAGLCLTLLTPLLPAQVEHGGSPPSQGKALRKLVPTARMRPVRADLLLAEDDAQELAREREPANKPLRFADVLAVDLGLASAGVWEELGRGDRVWRLRIQSPGAKSLALVFQRYQLPAGAELYVYDDERKNVRGAYTELENGLSGEFAMRPLRGDALTLEYYEPGRSRGLGDLVVGLVAHDYRGVLDVLDPQDRSGSGGGTCMVDVACPPGLPFANQINACVKIFSISEGAFCSGSLLNNTANDGSLLVLSAAHCGNLSTAVFTFNFQRPGCRTGTAPTTRTITGATNLVTASAVDVQLVRLNVPQLPLIFPVFLAGWDRTDVAPTTTALIHHPGGGEKKISTDADAPGKTGNFWRVFNWERGATEGGSSGAPLFDPTGHFIGNLDSGASTCPSPNNDFCTRLAAGWPFLEPYLDPLGTGQLTIEGLDRSTLTKQPFDVTDVIPRQIPVLDPSTTRNVRLVGSGFRETTEVLLNGIVLPIGAVALGGYSTLNINMPPIPVGQYTLSARENGVTKSLPLTVVGVTEPLLQVAHGIPDEQVFSTDGVDTYHADVPGHVHYCFWSLSNLPSSHPLLSLGIGNGFTDYRYCEINPIPARGFIRVHHGIPFGKIPFGTTVYNQAACISHGHPFAVTGVQQTVYVF